MDQFVIEGGAALNGVVTPSGNKNAALPMLAACLMTDQPVVLRNVPAIRDVITMRQLLADLGVCVETIDPHTWRIQAANISKVNPDPELCQQIRASILLAGPMLVRAGELELPLPGGDVIGRRRLDTHFLALNGFGAEVRHNSFIELKAPRGLKGGNILLDEASVTATENAIMAASMAQGVTVLRNAASEPHIQELCQFLNQLGARIKNIGSNTLEIEGVDRLGGGEFTIGADYLEVVSFVGAAAITGGEIRIRNAGPEYLGMVRLVFKRLGVHWIVDGEDILVPTNQSLRVVSDLGGAIPEIKNNIWPAFPTDLMSIAIVIATQCHGSALFHDWMYSGRMFFIDKLAGMGARIILCDPHRCLVQGPAQLLGEKLESPDIRAGMAILLAALAARGTSTIRNIGQIERGYERIDEKLRGLGARIERVGL